MLGLLSLAKGAAPFTLIDGDTLVDLLFEAGIGTCQRTTEPLEMDAAAFGIVGMYSREQRGIR